LPGCSGGKPQVAPGSGLDVREEFSFFLHQEGERYSFPPLTDVTQLLEEKSWQVPKGVTLERPVVNLNVTKVKWSEGRTEYTADGYTAIVSCRLVVAEDAEPGERILSVTFPNLVSATRAGGVTPRKDKQTALLLPSGALEVKRFIVGPSRGAKKTKSTP
jgi:hypothetical protein